MKVCLVNGPFAGSYHEVFTDSDEFLVEGVKYTLVYEILGTHPTCPSFRLSTPMGLLSETLSQNLAEPVDLPSGLLENMIKDQAWRYFPRRTNDS